METTSGVGLSGADSVAQFDLLHQSVTSTVPLSLTRYGSTTSVAATWLAAKPGTDTTLAVGGYGIFDISGNTGSFRPNAQGGYTGVDPYLRMRLMFTPMTIRQPVRSSTDTAWMPMGLR